MKKRLSGMLTLLLALVVQISFAQEQRPITGTVTDTQGLPLPGVNVLVQDTNRGTQTDFDGNYSVNAAQGETLVFSFMGYETAEIVVGDISTIDVSLGEDAAELEEVVVVGYGTATKQSFTGTADVVSGEQLQRKNVSNVSKALTGETAGVRVINTSGQPGSSGTIRIRGIGSVSGNRAPLYVVDGVPYNGSINAINPSDIESTTILKDAAATAIYGARGANGVIVINTIDGVEGRSSIEVEVRSGQNFRLLPRYETIDSPDEYIELSWEAMRNRGEFSGSANPEAYANANLFSASGIDPRYNMWNVANGGELIDPATGLVREGVTRRYDPEDWDDYAFQSANRTETNLKMSGGNERSTYYTSFGYLNDVGYAINSDFERYSARLNVTHDVKDWLAGTMDMGYTLSESNAGGQSSDSGSVFWFADNIPPIYPLFLRNGEGNFVDDPYFGGNQYDYGTGRGFGALTNAIADAHYNIDNDKRHNINLNTSFTATLLEGLTLETRFGMQFYHNNSTGQNNPFYGSAAEQNGSVSRVQDQLFSYNFLQLLRYRKSFGDHTVEAFAAHESNSYEWARQTGYKSNLISPDATELNQGVVSSPASGYVLDYTLESYFGQVNYDFRDTYFLSGTIRRDGSSRFAEGNKWGTFGAVGAAWVLSNEAFMQDQDLLTNLKLKGSYGLIGEQAGVGYYPGADLYNVDNLNDELSVSFNSRGNPDLTWETSRMFQTGVEFSLGTFLDATVDYYVKNTSDLLFTRQVPISLGYASVTVNDGELRNTGIEFDVTAHLVNTPDFYLDFTVNGELIENEMITMPMDPGTQEEKILDQSGSFGRAEGHSVYDYYMREYAGVNAATGLAMWNAYYYDANGNGSMDAGENITSLTEYLAANPDRANDIDMTPTSTYSQATQKFIGKSAIPDVRGAFTLSTGYAGFDLSAQFLYQIGGYAYDFVYARMMDNDVIGGSAWHTDIRNRWQNPGDVTDVPRLTSGLDTNVSSTSTRFLSSADFLSLNNIRLGYTVPVSFIEDMGLSSLNVWVSGDNLMMLSERKGFDVTTSETGTSDWYTYSPLSTVTAGVRVNF